MLPAAAERRLGLADKLAAVICERLDKVSCFSITAILY
jgi:hypothetical protein